jgi:hypothetical protein
MSQEELKVKYPDMQYTLVMASNWKNIETEVMLAMRQGWTPLGGVAVDNGMCYQAMVRDSKKVYINK